MSSASHSRKLVEAVEEVVGTSNLEPVDQNNNLELWPMFEMRAGAV